MTICKLERLRGGNIDCGVGGVGECEQDGVRPWLDWSWGNGHLLSSSHSNLHPHHRPHCDLLRYYLIRAEAPKGALERYSQPELLCRHTHKGSKNHVQATSLSNKYLLKSHPSYSSPMILHER